MLKVSRGFSVVELMVAVALMALLLGLATPSYTLWVRNAQVRTVSDALQNGLRLAQAEAVRRHRQVVFFRASQATCNNGTAADASGNFWVIRTVPLVAGDPVETVQCGALADVAQGVALIGPAALCFNAAGRQVANANPGLGGTACVLSPTGTSRYDVAVDASDRPLRVLVALGGSVRLCDPARTRSDTAPDGCPP